MWSHAVVQRCKGTNEKLEEQLQRVFDSEFEMKGVKYPALVPESQRPDFLEKYYASMAAVND